MDIDTSNELETKAGIPLDAVVTHAEMMRAFEAFKETNDLRLAFYCCACLRRDTRCVSTFGLSQLLSELVSVPASRLARRRCLRPRGSAVVSSAVAIAPASPLALTGAQRVRSPQAMRGEGCAACMMMPTSMPPRTTGPPESPNRRWR